MHRGYSPPLPGSPAASPLPRRPPNRASYRTEIRGRRPELAYYELGLSRPKPVLKKYILLEISNVKNISQKTIFIFWIFAITEPSFATQSAKNIIVLLSEEDYKKEDVGTSSKDNAKIFFALFEKI